MSSTECQTFFLQHDKYCAAFTREPIILLDSLRYQDWFECQRPMRHFIAPIIIHNQALYGFIFQILPCLFLMLQAFIRIISVQKFAMLQKWS